MEGKQLDNNSIGGEKLKDNLAAPYKVDTLAEAYTLPGIAEGSQVYVRELRRLYLLAGSDVLAEPVDPQNPAHWRPYG